MSTLVRVELNWPEQNTVILGEDHYFVMLREGAVHLITSRCPHRGGPLHLGDVQEGRLRCPWHGSTFRVDRLCARSVSTVQRGGQVIAYIPAPEQAAPVATHTMVLAR
ncbi:MAG: nitrite reductase small subunit [Mycobacteriales bacterium]